MKTLQTAPDIARDLQALKTALKSKRQAKLFEVRFQEIRTYKVFVEANNEQEADFMAIREVQGNRDLNPIRSEYDFFTICPITPANQ